MIDECIQEITKAFNSQSAINTSNSNNKKKGSEKKSEKGEEKIKLIEAVDEVNCELIVKQIQLLQQQLQKQITIPNSDSSSPFPSISPSSSNPVFLPSRSFSPIFLDFLSTHYSTFSRLLLHPRLLSTLIRIENKTKSNNLIVTTEKIRSGSSSSSSSKKIQVIESEPKEENKSINSTSITPSIFPLSLIRYFFSPFIPSRFVLLSLTSSLTTATIASSSTNSIDIQPTLLFICELLAQFAEKGRIIGLIQELVNENNSSGSGMGSGGSNSGTSADALITTLCSIPDLVANSFLHLSSSSSISVSLSPSSSQFAIPNSLTTTNWITHIIHQSLLALASTTNNSNNSTISSGSSSSNGTVDVRISIISSMYSKLARRGHSDSICTLLVPLLIASTLQHQQEQTQQKSKKKSTSSSTFSTSPSTPPASSPSISQFQSLFVSLSVSCLEQIIEQLIIHLSRHRRKATIQSQQQLINLIDAVLPTLFDTIITNKEEVEGDGEGEEESIVEMERETTKRDGGGRVTSVSPSNTASSASHLRFLFTHKFLTAKPLSPASSVTNLLINFLYSISSSPSSSLHFTSPFDTSLVSVCRYWNNSQFVLTGEAQKQTYITLLILHSLHLIQQQQQKQQLYFTATKPVSNKSKTAKEGKNNDIEGEPIDDSDLNVAEDALDSSTPSRFGSFLNHPALSHLMNGVQIRLSTPIESIRQQGMKIAEEMSKLISPDQPLNFDIEEDQEQKEEKEELEKEIEEEKKEKEREEERRKKKAAIVAEVAVKNRAQTQQTETVKKLVTFAEDSSSSSSSSTFPLTTSVVSSKPLIQEVPSSSATNCNTNIPSYSTVDDRSDLRKVQPPRYLRDCLDLLRKPDDRDSIEAGLEGIMKLIGPTEQVEKEATATGSSKAVSVRSNVTSSTNGSTSSSVRPLPPDLPQLSRDLLQYLLQIGTTIHCTARSINLLRLSCIHLLFVLVPTHTIEFAISQIYSTNQTLAAKLEILTLLISAAEELSSVKQDRRLVQDERGRSQSANISGSSSNRSVESRAQLLPSSSASSTSSSFPVPAARMTPADLFRNTIIPTQQAQPTEQQQQQQSKFSPSSSSLSAQSSQQFLSRTDHERIISERVEKTARRWGQPRSTPAPQSINHFTQVAHLFFFPLISGLDLSSPPPSSSSSSSLLSLSSLSSSSSSSSSSSHLNFFTSDFTLLSRIIEALGLFILFSGPSSPFTRHSSKFLYDLLLVCRLHAQMNIRRICLLSFCRFLLGIGGLIFMLDYEECMNEIFEWLHQVEREEMDEDCKKWAQLGLNIIREHWESSGSGSENHQQMWVKGMRKAEQQKYKSSQHQQQQQIQIGSASIPLDSIKFL